MGRIVAPHGIRGWIKIRPFTEEVDGLLDYHRWWVGSEGAWAERVVTEGHAHGATLVAQLEGIADRDQAARLKGQDIAVPRAALPEAESGEYYWADLIGLAVSTREGQDLGRVTEVFETGANDVLVVNGDRERLVPFIKSALVSVDLAGGRIVVDWDPDF